MELNGTTCWPHFPGVIARVDYVFSAPGLEVELQRYKYEATIFGVAQEFTTYEGAVAWCVEQKDHARALAARQLPARNELERESGRRGEPFSLPVVIGI